MQYIQLKVQDSSLVPTPEEAGNVNYFIDLADNMPKFKTWTGEVLSVGGSTAIDIPTPLVRVSGPSNTIRISLTYTGLDLTNKNAEIFLFRWRNSKKRSRGQGSPSAIKKPARWVHPATENALSKWAGWNFFNGNHYYKKTVNGTELEGTFTGRITEWEIPSNLALREAFEIDFNRYMFRYFSDEENTQVLYDNNFISSAIDINDATLNNSIGSNYHKAKIVKFCLAVAIDNPLATKENGLCPKLFGPYSEPFYSVIYKIGGHYSDVELRAAIISQHQKVYKNKAS